MKGSEIREKFLSFFEKRGHKRIESSPLIPQGDNTLMFTNAGMNQFKSVFTGQEKRYYTKATSSQKCVRAGGKHNDLENVGVTARHHTFFEMLGNFSFGDYFKKEAIQYAWEFLTKECKIPREKLWITVFEDDDEAYDIWKDLVGVSEERIVRMGEKDNFWSMGDTGPCGPCSEIIFDQGEGTGCGRPECNIYCDCDRFLEIWNLVFMQFNRDKEGNITKLPSPSIDTGMGLERITAVLQNKKSNYDTDLIFPIIQEIALNSGYKYGDSEKYDTAMRVIADHLRAMTFLISDGVFPSNEGSGYVLRRIMRRAKRYQEALNIEGEYLYTLVNKIIEIMGDAYPEIKEKKELVESVILLEEKKFAKAIKRGAQIVEELIDTLKSKNEKILSGEDAFKLYDTYGFPLELSKEIFIKEGISIDEKSFAEFMERQKLLGQESWKDDNTDSDIKNWIQGITKTEFTGYSDFESEARIVKFDDEIIVLDRTPFYAESGGQVSDTGEIFNDLFKVKITNVIKKNDVFLHYYELESGRLSKDKVVKAKIDYERRKRIMYNHSATHLLQAALREIIGDHVQQTGSMVNEERLRFDFKHFEPLDQNQIDKVELLVNKKIWEQLKTNVEVKQIDDAKKEGALAFFEEKYGQNVRIVTMGDFSKEFCGGTHVHNSGEIGLFKIISETGVASSIRRIEAVTNENAYRLFKKEEKILNACCEVLKTKKDNIEKKINEIISDRKNLKKMLEEIKLNNAGDILGDIVSKASVINDISYVCAKFDNMNMNELRQLSDRAMDRIKSGIVALGSEFNGKAQLVVKISDEFVSKFKAGNIVRQVSEKIGGSGGGKPNMAQAGGNNPAGIENALEEIKAIIKRDE